MKFNLYFFPLCSIYDSFFLFCSSSITFPLQYLTSLILHFLALHPHDIWHFTLTLGWPHHFIFLPPSSALLLVFFLSFSSVFCWALQPLLGVVWCISGCPPSLPVSCCCCCRAYVTHSNLHKQQSSNQRNETRAIMRWSHGGDDSSWETNTCSWTWDECANSRSKLSFSDKHWNKNTTNHVRPSN